MCNQFGCSTTSPPFSRNKHASTLFLQMRRLHRNSWSVDGPLDGRQRRCRGNLRSGDPLKERWRRGKGISHVECGPSDVPWCICNLYVSMYQMKLHIIAEGKATPDHFPFYATPMDPVVCADQFGTQSRGKLHTKSYTKTKT